MAVTEREEVSMAGASAATTAMVHQDPSGMYTDGSCERAGAAGGCGLPRPGKWGALRLTTTGRRSGQPQA